MFYVKQTANSGEEPVNDLKAVDLPPFVDYPWMRTDCVSNSWLRHRFESAFTLIRAIKHENGPKSIQACIPGSICLCDMTLCPLRGLDRECACSMRRAAGHRGKSPDIVPGICKPLVLCFCNKL